MTMTLPHKCLPSFVLVDFTHPNNTFKFKHTAATKLLNSGILYYKTIEFLNKPLNHTRSVHDTALNIVFEFAQHEYGRANYPQDLRGLELVEDQSLIVAIIDYIGDCSKVLQSHKLYHLGRFPYDYEHNGANKVLVAKQAIPVY